VESTSAALDTGKPLVLVTGPIGIGRTTFLAGLGEELSRRGTRVSAIRFTRDGDAVSVSPAGTGVVAATPIGPVAGAGQDPEIAGRASAGVAARLSRDGGAAALLVDDAQWIDDDTRAVLESLVRRLAGTSAVCVCAVRAPVPVASLASARKLHGDGLVHSVRLRPMTGEEISRKLAVVTQAEPDADLIALVRAQSRGIPAAVRDSTETLRRNGSVQVVGGRAYLVPGAGPMDPPRDNEFVRAARDLGPAALAAARAAGMLAPLGEDVPRLVGDVLGTTEPQAVGLLESLRREGVLHRGRGGRSWRLPVPLVAAALVAGLGPFERRQIAAKAVTDVWAGDARCADQDHLTDLVAEAGRLVDPRRAFCALLGRSTEAGEHLTGRVSRWLGTAVELAENRAERAMVMLRHTTACHAHGDHERGLRGARCLLTDFADQLTPDAAQEVQVMAVRALKSVGETEALVEIAEARRRWTEDLVPAIVTRALANGMLDRWGEVRDLLARTENRWRAGNVTSAMFGAVLQTLAALWTGGHDQFERGLAARADWPLRDVRRHRVEQVSLHVTALLVTGDTTRAEKLSIDEDLPVEDLPLGERALFAALRGEAALAVDLIRRGIANREQHLGAAATHQTVVDVLVSQGKLTTAREMLVAARKTDPPLGHLLDIAEARIDRALGEDRRAAARLHDCLTVAAARGLVIGTDLCWAESADLALTAGDPREATRCLGELERLAETMPTGRTLVHVLLTRATVRGDRGAAAECLRLARDRGQPMELATVSERLVRRGVGDPALLGPAYELLGGLDALLRRSWLRNLMREHGVVVPGRRRTVEENERLLAMLAADGLTNRQLAAVLRTTEKSVEGRLSRMFTRTGYRSRIELSAAIRDGELQLGT
jgi:hypothetical protein